MTDHITVNTAGGILTLVMNRPDKRNALTDVMYGVLADQIEAARNDAAIRVIVLRGEGDMFTAGNDVMEFALSKPGSLTNVLRFIQAIAETDKPLVAAVQGRAVGIGTTMLLHCDYVILADDAVLSTPFVNLGLVPEAGASLLLPARIGHLRAFAMLALGETVGAADAIAWGLATATVPADHLVASVEAVAARIAKQPIGAVMATKRLMHENDALAARMVEESQIFAARLRSPEAREAFTAFAQRRAPEFEKVSLDETDLRKAQ
ncbi:MULTISPECIES: enoyl-CoA hydratase [Alphaproteobacteria]|uniref:enoyl-CoA hydratase n=1 Tax=Alphaproteobacteria TaxID=28211 RepID=UPI0026251D62|nr:MULTISPECIES: enoyl-CoA hydratase [Alphaproteobacteria]